MGQNASRVDYQKTRSRVRISDGGGAFKMIITETNLKGDVMLACGSSAASLKIWFTTIS
jgi:hypothetical protein